MEATVIHSMDCDPYSVSNARGRWWLNEGPNNKENEASKTESDSRNITYNCYQEVWQGARTTGKRGKQVRKGSEDNGKKKRATSRTEKGKGNSF